MGEEGRGEGAARAAACVLRVCGGRAVKLRVARAGAGGSEAEQMGLSAAAFEDVELGPAVVRGAREEVLIAGEAVRRVVGSLQFGSARVLFAQAAGVVIGETLWPVTSVREVEAGGVVVAYRVSLGAAE